MFAIQPNAFTHEWTRIGARLPKPRAVLAISAHWYQPGTAVTINTSPRTIHDFGGFPDELFEVQYPAPGDPELAQRVCELLSPVTVLEDDTWGLDHGTWSVLKYVYPNADVPVVQLSINSAEPAMYHYEIGRALAPLRDEGVLILGSGNIVHNLREFAWRDPNGEAFDWAARFERHARELIEAGDHAPLIDYKSLGRDADLSIPTPDHYLPLLYVLGAQTAADTVSFPVEGIDGKSMSMLAVEVQSAE